MAPKCGCDICGICVSAEKVGLAATEKKLAKMREERCRELGINYCKHQWIVFKQCIIARWECDDEIRTLSVICVNCKEVRELVPMS